MTNPVMGEVSFESGGKTYTFKMGTYAQAILERRTKQPMNKFFQRDEDGWGVDDLLSVFYAGLYRAHKLTEEQVADLMDEVGLARVTEIITESIAAANPDKPETAGAADTAESSGDPTTAKA